VIGGGGGNLCLASLSRRSGQTRQLLSCNWRSAEQSGALLISASPHVHTGRGFDISCVLATNKKATEKVAFLV